MSKDDISLEGVSNPAQEAGDVQAEDASQKEVCPAQEAEDFQEDDASLEEADPAQETGNTQADVSLEYKPSRRSRAKLTPLRGLLMAGVIFVVPWIIWGERQDLAYFFTSSVPIDLGLASDYRLASPGETTKAQDFEDNRLIRIEGYPMRQVAIRMQDNPVTPARNRLIYQLLGSSIYVQEDFENSKYAQFFAATHDTPGQSGRGAAVEVTGRLRRFDVSQSKRYAAVREHYSQRYGTVFCQEMTQAERLRRAALLGKGGVALQIMPDGSILSGETGTTATLTSALPLRGRHAMVVGNGNTLLHTSDAGLTWRQTKLPFTSQVTSMTFDTSRDAVLFGARGGWVGGIEEVRDDVLLNIAQDVHSLAYVPAEDANPASLLAVGKEGLVQVAFADREGWLPAQIEARQVLHDILHTGNRWFVAGGQGLLMTQTTDGLANGGTWVRGVAPLDGDWFSLLAIPGAILATGQKGQVVRYRLDGNLQGSWEIWETDDVPGIEFNESIRASAISDNHKTWVAVGDNGALMIARAQDDGQFGRIERISASYIAYGWINDVLAGEGVHSALSLALARRTTDDIYDVIYHDGQFLAVGDNGLFMTSQDGHGWTKQRLHIKDRAFRSILFVDDKTGFIGGERGTLLATRDGGETWRTMKAPTERTIYHLAPLPDRTDAFVFTGAYGLWGYCYTSDERCYLRSRTESFHYHAAAMVLPSAPMNKLQLVAVGTDARIDFIDDAKGSDARQSLWDAGDAAPRALIVASAPLPLKPGYAQGHLAFVGIGQGGVYRSQDGGYTFRREATGLTSDVHKIFLSPDGEAVFALGQDGTVAETYRGYAQWQRVPGHVRVIDGLVLDKRAFVMDDRCLYQKALVQREGFETVACLPSKDMHLQSMAYSPQHGILMTAVRGTGEARLGLYALNPGAGQTEFTEVLFETERSDLPATARLLACGQNLWLFNQKSSALWNLDNGRKPSDKAPDTIEWQSTTPALDTLADPNPGDKAPDTIEWQSATSALDTLADPNPGDKAPNTIKWQSQKTSHGTLADAWCDGQNLMLLAVKAVADHQALWEASVIQASTEAIQWTARVGFDPSNSKMKRSADGRWWWTAPSPIADSPLILMSHDGRKWSWRRDRITDFHAVDVVSGAAAATGDDGSILISYDRGISWKPIRTSVRRTLRDICLSADGKFGIAVGEGGTILRAQGSLERWTRLGYKLEADLTSCAIIEQPDRFAVYIAGKGGVIYVSTERELGRFDLVSSPSFEDLYALAALETGEVIAVGGSYQDPDRICEEGFIVIDGEHPKDMIWTFLVCLGLAAFWGYTLRNLIVGIARRREDEDEDEEFR